MLLHSPFVIGSRLLPALRIGGAELSLEFIGVRQNRCVWRWYIDLDGAEYSAADLTSPADDTQAAFGSLLGFLGACAEAYHYCRNSGRESENLDLFPLPVAEWAYRWDGELSMAREEIEAPGAVLIDE